MHLLKEYIDILRSEGLLVRCSGNIPDAAVRSLTFDSREASDGTLFVCKGRAFREEFLSDAVCRGAFAYVSETEYESAGRVSAVIVSDIRAAMPHLAKLFYDDAPAKLTSVGLTGTKGKTTTAYFIRSVLDGSLPKGPAFVSSVDTYDGVTTEESHMTTPEAFDMYRICSNAAGAGLTHFVAEVSSQALKYGRVGGISFDIGVFHNFGRDHISSGEHDGIEDYFASKLKIFSHCRKALVNSSSDRFGEILSAATESCSSVVRYGKLPCDDYCMTASEAARDGRGGSFRVREPDGTVSDVRYSIPGGFNAENALCAYAVCRELGIPRGDVLAGIAAARVSGRMEVFDSPGGKIRFIVDYAHNEMSFLSLYDSIEKESAGAGIITVFGCPGGKAYQRRVDLAECSAAHSALTVLTEEDPFSEPVYGICGEIASRIEKRGGRYVAAADREQAVRYAFSAACEMPGRVVIAVTGKGDEEFMKRSGRVDKIRSDVSVVKDILSTCSL